MPVYSNIALEYAELGLGERIRAARKRKGWTLHDLAQRVSISIASLSAIENDKAVLDLERLAAISHALDVRTDVLLPYNRSCHFHLARRSAVEADPPAPLKVVDAVRGALTTYHNLLRPLADPFVGKHLEPFHIEVQPVADDSLQFISHHHEEFVFVLRGEVECLLKTPTGLIREVLGPGDCIHFWSYLPHCIRSTSPHAAHSVHLLYSAQGAMDSEYASGRNAVIYFRDASHKTRAEQIGARITSLRQGRGMSIAELARDLDIGVRQLTEIEKGRKALSIELLLRICRLFRKPAEYFLSSTLVDPPFHSVLHASELARLPARQRRAAADDAAPLGTFKALSGSFAKGGMYPYYVRLPLVPEEQIRLHEHHGQEFVYVLNGQVRLYTVEDGGRVTRTMSAGDSCFIDSTVPHRFAGIGLSPYEESSAELINVFWCPLGESYLFVDDDEGAESDGAQSASPADRATA